MVLFAAAEAANGKQSGRVGTLGKPSTLPIIIQLISLVLCECVGVGVGFGLGNGVWRDG